MALRREQALGLRVQGASYAAIGRALGVSGKTAFYDIATSLAEVAKIERKKALDVLQMELMRLDRVYLRVSQIADGRNPDGEWKVVTDARGQPIITDGQPKMVRLPAPTIEQQIKAGLVCERLIARRCAMLGLDVQPDAGGGVPILGGVVVNFGIDTGAFPPARPLGLPAPNGHANGTGEQAA